MKTIMELEASLSQESDDVARWVASLDEDQSSYLLWEVQINHYIECRLHRKVYNALGLTEDELLPSVPLLDA